MKHGCSLDLDFFLSIGSLSHVTAALLLEILEDVGSLFSGINKIS